MNMGMGDAVAAKLCPTCGIPWDAGYFDESRILDLAVQPLNRGDELVLARYQLHRNYCGILMSFAQFTDAYGRDNSQALTPGYQWQVRVNDLPRDPYVNLDHILNPWGTTAMPVHLRLEESSVVELTIRNVGVPTGVQDPHELRIIGGRITGRFWYNLDFGGRPNRL